MLIPWTLRFIIPCARARPPAPTFRAEKLLEKEKRERRRQQDNARRLRGALRHLLADGETLGCADTCPTPNEAAEGIPGHEPKLESLVCCSSVGTPEQPVRDDVVSGRGYSAAPPRVAAARELRDSFALANRLGHGKASPGDSDFVGVTAAVGE